MGMFDTFHIQDQGTHFGVQSKQFACILNDYLLGDFAECMYGFIRHDYEKERQDRAAIARLPLELPQYRERVPACYAVGAELEAANPGREKT